MRVPVYAAGVAADVERTLLDSEEPEVPTDYILFPTSEIIDTSARVSAHRVIGECMAPLAHDGELVVLEVGAAWHDGDDVVARVGGALQFKTIRQSNGSWELVAEDGGRLPLREGDEVIAVVNSVIRKRRRRRAANGRR